MTQGIYNSYSSENDGLCYIGLFAAIVLSSYVLLPPMDISIGKCMGFGAEETGFEPGSTLLSSLVTYSAFGGC